MTAPMFMTDCPTEETLAAFVDDRLDAPNRRKVMEHVAGCGECRELVLMTTDFQMSEAPTNVVRPRFPWIPTAGLAAAAVIAVFALRPAFVVGPDMGDVLAAWSGAKYRPGVGRSAALPYKPEPPNFRSGTPTSSPDEATAMLLGIAAEARDPHVRGVARYLAANDGEDLKAAIEDLKMAYDGASSNERDVIAIDYATALIAYSDRSKDPKIPAMLALELSEKVWASKRMPEAGWNRAAALDKLGRTEDAVLAFEEMAKLEPGSPWAAEAEKHKKQLTGDF